MYQNNEMTAILVYGTGISSFLFKYFVLFHHPTGATDHVSENDLLDLELEQVRFYRPAIQLHINASSRRACDHGDGAAICIRDI